jgi:hypothetical protein
MKYDAIYILTHTRMRMYAYFVAVQDVIRTHPEIRFFLEDTTHIHYSAMQRILFVYAKLNPGVKYVQVT